MRIEEKIYLDFDDVLIRPKRSALVSRKDIDLERSFTFLHSKKTWKGVPIIASNMDTVGTWEMRDALNQKHIDTMIHKFYTPSVWKLYYIPMWVHSGIEFSLRPTKYVVELSEKVKYTIPSFGMKEEDTNLLKKLINEIDYFPNRIAFDVANGYTEKFVNHIKQMRELFGDKITIIAGNVATPEAVESLILAGADIVKVGIGTSRICDTRIKTGIGVPQLTALVECSDSSHGLGGHIISDGGCKTPADIVKAFAAGADWVMIGSMLAGHDESGGETIIKDSVSYKEVYGMSSEFAMKKHFGEKANYRASEGNYKLIPLQGPVVDTIDDILGGLRSACTYVGASRLKDLSKCTTFIKVNRIK